MKTERLFKRYSTLHLSRWIRYLKLKDEIPPALTPFAALYPEFKKIRYLTNLLLYEVVRRRFEE